MNSKAQSARRRIRGIIAPVSVDGAEEESVWSVVVGSVPTKW